MGWGGAERDHLQFFLKEGNISTFNEHLISQNNDDVNEGHDDDDDDDDTTLPSSV